MLKNPNRKSSKNKRHPDLVRKEKEAAKQLAREKKLQDQKVKDAQKKAKLKEKKQKLEAKLNSSDSASKKSKSKKASKKATAKPSGKTVQEISQEHNFRELLGWFIIIFSLVGVLSVVAQFAAQGGSHLFGPYLGDFLATNLIRAFGKLPVLLVLIFGVLLGIKTLAPSWDKLQFRFLVFAFLSTAQISLLLSVNHQTLDQPLLYDFENSGGYLGNLGVHFILQPIFRSSLMGSYITLGTLFFLTLIWGIHWKPSIWIAKVLTAWIEIVETAKLRAQERAEERLMQSSPAEQLIRKKKQDELIKKKLTQAHEVLKEEKISSDKEAPVEELPLDEISDQEVQERALDAVQILNSLSMEDRNSMDQRELRKLIEDAKQIDIARQLNQWEFGDKSSVKIEGIISNEPLDHHDKGKQEDDSTREMDISSLAKPPKTQPMKVPDNLSPASPEQEFSQPPIHSAQLKEPDPELKPQPKPKPKPKFEEYVVPDIVALLPEPPSQKMDLNPKDLQLLSEQLEAKMATFKVQGKVVGITTGPVITRFEIDLAPGVKVSKISGLERDLALALKAKSIRILAPIPGKAAVGIEIPNLNPQIVYGKSILLASAQEDDPDKITIALGKDIAGEPYTMDLAKAPHLLIAGQTGSGKSVCINTLMASILSSKKPDELKMLLVDPKVVELKPYEDIPHLLHPVVTDPELAVSALKWACWEMDRRYDILAKIRTRNIAGFNAKIAKGGLEDKLSPEDNKKMPFIVIMIDELADLMMVAGKEVEVSIARIAQKARAVGIHLVLATQRPSTNVITGTIKANLPTRICFKVASHIDARTVMDKAGGEKLLGRGDMLFRSISDPEPVRVHGAFLTDDEVEVVTDSCSEQNVQKEWLASFDYDGSGGDSEAENDGGPRDDLFNDAAELAVHTGKASASLLQRRLQIGFARAGRVIDQLEAAGIVGPGRGAKPRSILMDETELKSFLSGDTDRIILEDD